jgi:PAS domain S-box-containing protein
VIIYKPGGRVLTWNRGAERLYGFPASEIVCIDVRNIMDGQFQADTLEVVARFSDDQGAYETEARRRRKDGSVVDVTLTTIRRWTFRNAGRRSSSAATTSPSASARLPSYPIAPTISRARTRISNTSLISPHTICRSRRG